MKNNYRLQKSDKFKTNYLNVRFVIEATKQNASYISLLSIYQVYNNNIHKTYKEASDYLDSLYGARFDINTSLKGNIITYDFSISFIANKYLEEKDYLQNIITEFINYIYNPLQDNNKFDQENFDLRKYDMQERIKASYDDKGTYAYEKFFENFGQNYPLAINMNGDLKTVETITNEKLYDFFNKLKTTTPFVSGIVASDDFNQIEQLLQQNIPLNDYNQKTGFYNIDLNKQEIIESQEITQSKLLMGYVSSRLLDKDEYYKALIYNSLFGMGANSYLFKIVREKENLCYTIRSNYDMYSNTLYVMSGIEKQNYEKAVTLVEQIHEKIKNNDFTDAELEDAKTVVIDMIEKTRDSQAGLVMYDLNRTMANMNNDLNIDIEKIKQINREDIVEIANLQTLSTTYLLRGEKNE